MFSLSMCWAKVSPPGHLFMARTEADKQWTRLKGDASSSWNYTSAVEVEVAEQRPSSFLRQLF